MKAHATPQQRLRSRNRLRREFKEPIRNAGHAWLFTLPTVTDTAHTLGRERRKERHKSEMSGKKQTLNMVPTTSQRGQLRSTRLLSWLQF